MAALVFGLLAISGPAGAESEFPEGSAGAVGEGHVSRYDAGLKTLDRLDKRLRVMVAGDDLPKGEVRYFDERLNTALKAQQTAWRTYVAEECEMVGVLAGGASTWQSARNLECQANLVEQRVRHVRNAIRCIARIEPKKRPFEEQTCLYQLTPLAVPLRR